MRIMQAFDSDESKARCKELKECFLAPSVYLYHANLQDSGTFAALANPDSIQQWLLAGCGVWKHDAKDTDRDHVQD